jgi:thioredoxin-related protein
MRILKNSILPILCLLMILVLNKETKRTTPEIIDQPIIEQKIILTYQEALEASKNTNKDILLLVDAKWCGYCIKFKDEVLSEEEVKNKIKEYVVCSLDYKSNMDIIKKYNIRKLPTYILIDKDENIIKEGYGYQTRRLFLDWLNSRDSQK